MKAKQDPNRLKRVWGNIYPGIDAAIASLAPFNRDVVFLRYLEHREIVEIAKILNRPTKVVVVAIDEAFTQLRANLVSLEKDLTKEDLMMVFHSHLVHNSPTHLRDAIMAAIGKMRS